MPPKPRTLKSEPPLLTAIKSLSHVLKPNGTVHETHIQLHDGWAVAHNQIIGMGERVPIDLYACPNAQLLQAALTKCEQNIAITQLDTNLSIKSDKFRALVPCLPPDGLPRVFPDAPVAQLDDRLKAAFLMALPLGGDDEHALTASILLANGSVVTTDRKVILDCWHGIDLPTLMLPKTLLKLMKSVSKKFKAFGFSNNSFTIYLEDDSWIKSQLYIQEWPDVFRVLNGPSNPLAIPDGLWEALDAVEDFSDDGWAYTRDGRIGSHQSDDKGAYHECYGIPPGITFSINQLQEIKPWAKKIDFFAKSVNGMNCIKAFGDTTRCVIAGKQQ
jgi:hypothetical protein